MKWGGGGGLFEGAIILIKMERLFKGGNKSRDGYYSRKYGNQNY